MKILGLQIQGVGIIKALELKFKENGLIPIVGGNNQGKTTVLKCLEMLIAGRSIENDIVNHDSTKAVIVGHIDDYKIKKVIIGKTTRLEITKDDMVMKKPQTFLDSLFNKLSFNPFDFINKSPTEKYKDFMEYAGIDFSGINEQIKSINEDEKYLRRTIKDRGALRDEPEKVENDVDVASLHAERDKQRNEYNEGYRVHIDTYQKELQEVKNFNQVQRDKAEHIARYSDKIEKINIEIESLKRKLQDAEHNREELILVKNDLPLPENEKELPVQKEYPPENYDKIDQEIVAAGIHNKKYRDYLSYIEELNTRNADLEKLQHLKKEAEKLKEQKRQTLKDAKLPIEDLELREDGLFYNDIYVENLSTSESLKLACNICVSMKPEIRAITIDRGESLDANNLKYLEEFGKKNNFQCFITIVDSVPSDKKDGVIYIEEGAQSFS